MYDKIGYTLDTDLTTYNTTQFISSIPREVITYKGVELTIEDLDTLIAKKKVQQPAKPKERVVFDGDYTIYYDKNGKKTVVHKMPDEVDDPEKAVLWALLKSKGVKPKDVTKLMDNAVDRDYERLKKDMKKISKTFRQLSFEDFEDFELPF